MTGFLKTKLISGCKLGKLERSKHAKTVITVFLLGGVALAMMSLHDIVSVKRGSFYTLKVTKSNNNTE